jgi:thiol:disulfide interchange protein
LSEHSSQQQKEAHRKQKQWDQKHAELHARWQAAQRKQEEQEKADRKRAALIAYCMAGLIIAMIICVFLWYA